MTGPSSRRPGASLVLLVRWIRAERAHAGNTAKWVHLTSTGALFVTMFINPVAGFMGYVGSHAVEYFGLLVWALASISSLAFHAAVIFTLGGMHVFYYSFIWKLRRPVVAHSQGI